jgi:hypothetical protein
MAIQLIMAYVRVVQDTLSLAGSKTKEVVAGQSKTGVN